MNPLGNIQYNGLSPQLMQNVRQVKSMMQMMNGNPMTMAQQNPMFNQVMQMCQGQNPQQIFMNKCKEMGINPDAILNELRS